MPIILESARITVNGILQQDKLPLYDVKPLPDVNFDFEDKFVSKKVIPV